MASNHATTPPTMTTTYGQLMAAAGLPCASVSCARCGCGHAAPEAARIGPSLCDMHRPAAAVLRVDIPQPIDDNAPPAELIYGNGIIDDDELCEDFGDCY